MTKRRVKGEGSVYRRKDGRVVAEYLDANGRKRYITSTTKTKAEMKTALRNLLVDRDQGVAYDSEDLSVGGYLDKWLAAIKGTVKQRTWQRHEEVVRLGSRRLLTTTSVRRGTALGRWWSGGSCST